MGNTQVYAKESFSGRVPASGVYVETLKVGDGENYPLKGVRAGVKYEGTLENGQKFGGNGFFPVGMGGVDKCLDESIMSMSLGETARVQCTPDAYYKPVSDLYPAHQQNVKTFNLHLHSLKSCNAVDGC